MSTDGMPYDWRTPSCGTASVENWTKWCFSAHMEAICEAHHQKGTCDYTAHIPHTIIVLALCPVFKSFVVTGQVCAYTASVCPEFMDTWTKLAVFLGFLPELGAVKLRLWSRWSLGTGCGEEGRVSDSLVCNVSPSQDNAWMELLRGMISVVWRSRPLPLLWECSFMKTVMLLIQGSTNTSTK